MEKYKRQKPEGYDQHLPEGKFAFDENVTVCFDNMLERSIPTYQTMRHLTQEFASRYINTNSTVIDIGVSLGQAIKNLIIMHPDAHFIGLDVSEPMLRECRKKFADYINRNQVDILHCDLRDDFPQLRSDVVLSVLTLQFTPIEYRHQILANIYESLKPGGAFLLVEKVIGADAKLDAKMVDVYYDMKGEKGYTEEQIKRKRLALEGVLVPVTAYMNETFLKATGFKSVDCYWRWSNFAAWIAIK